MNQSTLATTTLPPVITPVAGAMLQRLCACGSHSVGGGECEGYRKKRKIQRRCHRELASIEPDSINATFQAELIDALVGSDGERFQRVLASYVHWHRAELEQKVNARDIELFLNVPALALSALAREDGLVETMPADLPVELLEVRP